MYVISDLNSTWLFLKDVLSKPFNKHAPITSKRLEGHFFDCFTVKVKSQINGKDYTEKIKTVKSIKTVDRKIHKTGKNNCVLISQITLIYYMSMEIIQESFGTLLN